MTEYAKLAAELNRVRRAWKRRAAMAGLAVAVLEALALFTLILLVDWLYAPPPVVRVALSAVAVGLAAVLVARHVVAPLVRKIPDEQLALYVEEHRDEFRGALVTAAEFGRGLHAVPGQARLISAVVDEAASRAARVNLPRVVEVARLRKYGVAAAILLAAYAAMCLVFPQSVGHHAARVLAPWRPTAEDLAAAQGGPAPADRPFEEAMKQPVAFTLSREDTRLPRGGEFGLEAVLSRPPDSPVRLQFRPAAEAEKAEWRELPMKEIDRLNGFAAALRDVNEDLQFRVVSGPDSSDIHRIAVYDPLVVQAVEVTTRFPAYLRLPDRVDPGQSGDVAAPLGSSVTVRLRTNNPLASGSLRWQERPEQGLQVEDPRTSAAASFEVREDGTYTFALRDVDGQERVSAVPAYVRALKDQPPTLDVKFPRIDVATHPLGQLSALVEAADDWAVETVDLVYQVAAEGAPPEVRVPLAIDKARGTPALAGKAVVGSTVFALEDVRPAVRPGTLVTYHFQARDQKGQTAMSDIYMITVTPFEQWATWGLEAAEPATEGGYLSSPLSVVLAAVWHLHTQKDTLPPDEFNRQAEDLAKTMVDPATGEVFPFVDLKKVPPDKMDHARRVPELARKAHAALRAHDTAKAVEFLRLGLAELAIIGLSESPMLVVLSGGGAGGAAPEPESALAQIATYTLEAQAAEATLGAAGNAAFEIIGPAYRRELRKAEEAEELQKKTEELQKGEQDILDRALALADKGADAPPADASSGQQAGRQAGGQQAGGQQAGGQQAGGQQAGGQQAGGQQAGGQQAGGQQAGGQQEGGQQAGGQQEGGQQAGGQQAGGQQAGGQQEGGQQAGGQQAGGQQAGQQSGQPAGRGDSAGAVARDQRGLAERTKVAAMDARAVADADAAFSQVADKLGDAARDMFLAADKMDRSQMDAALADARRAQANLLEAARGVQGLQRHGLEQAIDLALQRGEQVLRDQTDIRSATAALADALGSDGKPTPGQQRDLRGLAVRQAQARTSAERLQQDIAGLREKGRQGARTDTARGIDDTHRAAERSQIAQKMVNAAVELDARRPAAALPEQARAEAGLQGVLDRLRQTAGTLASDYKSELVRAKHEADRVASALERLGGKAPPSAQAGDRQAGDQQAGGQQAGDRQAGGQQVGAPAHGLGAAERRELSQRTAAELATLARHLDSRRLAPEESAAIRKAVGDADALAAVLAADEARREELLGVVRQVGGKLTAELESRLQAERLKDFQREECPPQYRPLVNKYYEVLSQTVRE